MKRVLAVIVCSLCIVGMMSGCGEKENESYIDSSNTSKEESITIEEEQEDAEVSKGIEQKDVPEGLNYEYIDRTYGFRFWVDTMNGTSNDQGTSYRFSKGHKMDLFIMKYTVDASYSDAELCDLSKITSSKDIFAVMEEKFKKNLAMGKYLEANYTNLETLTVNGVEMTKFEGNYLRDGGFETPDDFAFIGYQILAKNRPIVVILVEKDPYPADSNISEYWTMLDNVVSTFVDEEGGTKEPGYLE